MRALVAIACFAALVLAGCGEDDEEPAATPEAAYAELVVEVDGDGEGGKAPERSEVRCETADEAPCADLKPETFEPTPRGTACTQQFGGPETATVTGTFAGKVVDAEFTRANGCEITRWEQASALLGG
jgi:hypothetical protein